MARTMVVAVSLSSPLGPIAVTSGGEEVSRAQARRLLNALEAIEDELTTRLQTCGREYRDLAGERALLAEARRHVDTLCAIYNLGDQSPEASTRSEVS